jgi:hypothetical protein
MRRKRRNVISAQPVKTRAELEALHGRVWTLQEVAREFVITSIIGTTVVVRRKTDSVVGLLEYQGDLYFDFRPQPLET